MHAAAGNVGVAFFDALQLLFKPLMQVAADKTLCIGAPILVVKIIWLTYQTVVTIALRSGDQHKSAKKRTN